MEVLYMLMCWREIIPAQADGRTPARPILLEHVCRWGDESQGVCICLYSCWIWSLHVRCDTVYLDTLIIDITPGDTGIMVSCATAMIIHTVHNHIIAELLRTSESETVIQRS